MTLSKIKLTAATLAVVAGITIPVVQNRSIERLRVETTELRAQITDVESLRAENAQLKQSEVDAAEIQRLRAQESELLKLRGEVTLLRKASVDNAALQRQLATLQRQLFAAQSAARHLFEGAQMLAMNNPSVKTHIMQCLTNLKQIDGAKESWALENKKRTGDVPTMADLVPDYIKIEPKCPIGNASYILNPIGADPVCPNYNAANPDVALHRLGPAQ